MKEYKLFGLLFLFVLLLSCVSKKELTYFSDYTQDYGAYDLQKLEQRKIKPLDELYIRVSSFDDVSYNFFSSQQITNVSAFANEQSISLNSFSVNDSGYIYFPILGKILVKDLTIEEACDELQKLLSDYFNQPTVLMKLVNKKITVLGEVLRPGSYLYTKERINIFEALGIAGDINQYGNRERVILMRQQDGTMSKRTLNLLSENIFLDKDFYLQQDDILYIEPQKTKKWSVISSPWSLTLTTVTTLVLVLNFIYRF